MQPRPLAAFLLPWAFRREQLQQRIDELRQRDGDRCTRCRRPMRFDVPRGHDQGPALEQIRPGSKGGSDSLDNLCLCHSRCNWAVADNTPEVLERLRRKREPARKVA